MVYIQCILLAYASEQICLPYGTYTFHCTNTYSTCRPYITAHIKSNNNELQFVITMILPYAINKYPSQIPYICHICQLLHMHTSSKYVSIFNSYKLTAISNVMISNGIHTFHITGICPEHICLPHCIYAIS